jgi:hypothetical protein
MTVEPNQTITPPEPDSRRAETSYVILELLPATAAWEAHNNATIMARTPELAIRAFAETLALTAEGTTFVAIPARSWKPVRVRPKTVTTLEIEEP